MPIKTSGQLGIDEIATEFGGTVPHGLNEYYAGGTLVDAGTRGNDGDIPVSGNPLPMNKFYGSRKLAAPGQVAFTTPGTFNWTVPEGVISVSVVCVGGGGGSFNSDAAGGGGGALVWANDITVTPGQVFTVVVGAGGQTGGQSYFKSATELVANGGNKGTNGGTGNGGTFAANIGVTSGGGLGGQGGPTTQSGGGGAGGYTGQGGRGGSGNAGSGNPGTGGAGGGGGGAGGGGGGVGLLGQGANGAGGAPNASGRGGSGGALATATSGGQTGGVYGGGGSGTNGGQSNRLGGKGAVRIIWPGNLRFFPTTRTADE